MTPLKSLKKLRSFSAHFLEGGGNFLDSVNGLLHDIQMTLAQLEQRERKVAAREKTLAQYERQVQQLIESLKLRAEADMTSLAKSLFENFQLYSSVNASPAATSNASASIEEPQAPLESQLYSDLETLKSELSQAQTQTNEPKSSDINVEAFEDNSNPTATLSSKSQPMLGNACSKPLTPKLHSNRPEGKKRRRR